METELCDNCNIAVPSVHFVMHVDFCKRNVQMCPVCGEAVPASQKEEHRQTFHVQINCTWCGVRITKSEEDGHLARQCPQMPVSCRFCPTELPRQDISEHEECCDLRSERCLHCGEHVLVEEQTRHREVCNEVLDRVLLPCEFCDATIAPNELMAHQRDCAERQGMEVQSEQGSPPLSANCPEGAFEARVVYGGEADGGEIQAQRPIPAAARASQATSSSHIQRNSRASSQVYNSVVALPCEICGDLCPSDQLMRHQEACIKENERRSRERVRQRGNCVPQQASSTVVGVQTEHKKATRVTYVRAERDSSLSSLEFEDDIDSDLDINDRFPRSIVTDVFRPNPLNLLESQLFSSTAFSHRINNHFGRLRNS